MQNSENLFLTAGLWAADVNSQALEAGSSFF